MSETHLPTATIILLGTYAILGLQGVPRLHIDSPSGALPGASATVAFGVLVLATALR